MATSYHTPSDLRLILPTPGTSSNGVNEDAATRLGPTAVEPATNPERPRITIDVSGWKLTDRRESRVLLEAKRKAIAGRIDAAAGMLRKSRHQVCALLEMREYCRGRSRTYNW